MNKIFYPKLINNFSSEVKILFDIFLKYKADSIRLVGGSVRDMLLKFEVKDFDFATVFLPEKILEILLENNIYAIPTGIKFGTITAVINHKHFEITTLRKDNENDGRYCKPEFIDDYFLDAARRDFTINALYLDNQGFVHDYFGGISDLENGVVKFIGEAERRIEEDFLRILRFFRFSAKYAKSIDNSSLEACIKNKQNIKSLSSERIKNEFFKIIENTENQKLLSILQIFENSDIAFEIFAHKLKIDNLKKLLKLENILAEKFSTRIKFAALFCGYCIDFKKDLTKLNFSNNEKKYFEFILKNIVDNSQFLDFVGLRKLLAFEQKDFIRDLYLLSAIKESFFDVVAINKFLDFIDKFILPKFPINGDDLIAKGFSGKNLGEQLLKIKQQWVESNFLATKDELLKL